MTDKDQEPVVLHEDERTGDRFLVYGTEKGVRLDIRYEAETLWMTQPQIAELFGVTRQSANTHLNNIYEEGELDRDSTCKEILQVRLEGGREVARKTLIHNLDAVIAVGYRVSSKQGTLFRRWATEKLVQFATKGFVVDSERLKQPDYADRVAELRDIIRDIRADEANVYREIKRICAMCQDYDGGSEIWVEFYRNTQAKLLYAVTSHTPAEIIASRANADIPNMGLTNWPNDNIRKTDVTISKSYLGDGEIKELNRLTTILLDIFEDQLDIGKLVVMNDARRLLDDQLRNLNRRVLAHGGHIKMTDAKKHAERQYEKFNAARKLERQKEADKLIAELKGTDKALPKSKPRR
jgi:hypothetical protein